MGIIKIALLISLIKLLRSTDNPKLCAGIYALGTFILGLFLGKAFSFVLIITAISFLLAWLYFWLLNKLDGSFLWWIVFLGGLLTGLV